MGDPVGELVDLQTRARANEAGHIKEIGKGKDRNKGESGESEGYVVKARNGEDMIERWREMGKDNKGITG
ncbi:hypothetical protein BDQ94DRAFT_155897 [Aspergillus welwitschiae]|uniref:Uncharacterized protein n=1 Tax=Aspergillus welwitschiae TaxID=1341132 RepID=A0A3F3PIK8_9EURO|nr:hypothetical protein BDQ94DRAFT_155897 [Aspergillus welwitschiae]RDH26176.1 hypothetical protein BDQ94DRAFT_155897 [Aspergillus welwitschiae]